MARRAYYGSCGGRAIPSGAQPPRWSSIDQSMLDATSGCSGSPPIRRRSRRVRRRARPRRSVEPSSPTRPGRGPSRVDLAEYVAVVDHGDVEDPDGEGGSRASRRGARSMEQPLTVILGGDNAATWHAMGASEGTTRGVRADHPRRTPRHARGPLERLAGAPTTRRGTRCAPRRPGRTQRLCELRRATRATRQAAACASSSATPSTATTPPSSRAAPSTSRDKGGRKVYVDIDLDVADRSVVPGCPAAAPGGLRADEMRRFVREITATSKDVTAIDFTEVDVERDAPDERTVRLGGVAGARGALGRAKENVVTIVLGMEPLTRARADSRWRASTSRSP